ncbi:MAG: MOSC domain-containing protein [Acidobacteria bacterium]|nr:MAG: MOSC domain-containing protein [Acidobacteriota bacterium]
MVRTSRIITGTNFRLNLKLKPVPHGTGFFSFGERMSIEIGHVEAVLRYPVKSMAGESLEVANLGWHGIDGDRRLALRRVNDQSGFPWLTAGKLPDLIRYSPVRKEEDLPTHIQTPDGAELPVFGEELAAEVARRYGAPVQMMQMRHGIFDDASVSVIASDTVCEIGRLAGVSPDVRRFRPNILVRLLRSGPFQEDGWLGGVLTFGVGDDAPAVAVTMRDVRCGMVNLDPDSGRPSPEVLKAVVRANQTNAGVYGAVTRIGQVAVGQMIRLQGAVAIHDVSSLAAHRKSDVY